VTHALVLLGILAQPPVEQVLPGPGIPLTLARERAAAITALRYELSFVIPEDTSTPIRGAATIRFHLAAPRRVVLDFAQPRDRLLSVTHAGAAVPVIAADGHIVVDAAHTAAGDNELKIEFIAGDESLNRNGDFLYTLFVPARAHRVFPCFDQPDLKGRYSLTLEMPAHWAVTANGAEIARSERDGRATVTFAETAPLPTYLFAFTAGKFTVDVEERGGRVFRMFHRETDGAKAAHNREALFALHEKALAWLEDYTGIAYPFGKFDFVLIPSFQFGGMEHAGAILYNAASMMLEQTATQNQLLERANTIAHETAHMWFGDLVTMQWFNDVWMKEVFANFIAGKIVNPSFPEVNHELRFLLANYPAAYDVDRTAGANPIRQELDNLNDAGSLYGAIIYQKAPIVMRQLEMLLGPVELRAGLREYLKQYSFGNATWRDLIRILDARTPEDLAAWSHVWVEERGRPRLSVTRHHASDGRLLRLDVAQRDPMGRALLWPQRIVISLHERGRIARVDVFLRGRVTRATVSPGFGRDAIVLLNGDGLAYGDIELDAASVRGLLAAIETLPGSVERGAAWITLWDALLNGRIVAGALIDTAVRALPAETDEQNTDRVLGYVVRAFWKHLPQPERLRRAGRLEAALRAGLNRARTPSQKATWFGALRDVTLTEDGIRWLARVWRRDEKIEGFPLAETDEIALAMELAVRDPSGAPAVLERQLERIQNPDRRARFAFVMPALSAKPAEREAAFARVTKLENRQREAWVLEAQRYLNHPLREAHAKRFVAPSLDLLQEIHRTGDIFFPKRWVDATLSGHRSREALAAVETFLAREIGLPERLRWVVQSSADELARVARR
jgi:aminopeptidase N